MQSPNPILPIMNGNYFLAIRGINAGIVFPILSLPATIGRNNADILPDPTDINLSTLHALVQKEENDLVILDQDSTNGTMVNGKVIKRHCLKNGDRIEVGRNVLKFIDPEVEIRNVRSRQEDLKRHDWLTCAYNLDHFEESLAEAFAQAKINGTPLGLLLIDMDQLDSANDTHGREFGDRVLMQFADLISSFLLEDQELYRLGGDEFAVLLQGPSTRFIQDYAEIMRQAVEVSEFFHGESKVQITISIGVTELDTSPPPGLAAPSVVDQAKRFLKVAKAKGGNKVCG